MKLHHRHSFFPLVLACLTLLLVALMYYSFTRQSETIPAVTQEISPVSSQEYDQQLKALGHAFMIEYQATQDKESRATLVNTLLADVLSLRVPVQQKEFHLSLAVALNQMQQTLKEKNGNESEEFNRIILLMGSKGIEYVAD